MNSQRSPKSQQHQDTDVAQHEMTLGELENRLRGLSFPAPDAQLRQDTLAAARRALPQSPKDAQGLDSWWFEGLMVAALLILLSLASSQFLRNQASAPLDLDPSILQLQQTADADHPAYLGRVQRPNAAEPSAFGGPRFFNQL